MDANAATKRLTQIEQALSAGRHENVIELATALIAEIPEDADRDAFACRVVARRYRMEARDALRAMRRTKKTEEVTMGAEPLRLEELPAQEPAVETKVCNKCRQAKPKSEFWRDKARPDGLMDACRTCKGQRTKEHRREARESKQAAAIASHREIPEGHQACQNCGHVFPATREYFHHTPSGAVSGTCKPCVSAARKASIAARRTSAPAPIATKRAEPLVMGAVDDEGSEGEPARAITPDVPARWGTGALLAGGIGLLVGYLAGRLCSRR